jgi:hypothetical protein
MLRQCESIPAEAPVVSGDWGLQMAELLCRTKQEQWQTVENAGDFGGIPCGSAGAA